jgi:glucoamylase
MNSAPGAPGIRPTWTSSDKDLVTTALGVSRVWATLGHGILNEVYWPETATPQLRDLGFIVAGPRGWFEVKRVNRYRISLPEPYIPLAHITHEGDGYRLVLEVVPDPLRDVVLISYSLTAGDMRLYALLAPHLNNNGERNNAAAREDLHAWIESCALCLIGDGGYSRTSAGYVGVSDGWQDFSHNRAMTWTYSDALGGNVALLGELASNQGTLALAFSGTITGARTKARSALSEGYAAIRQRFIADWRAWGKSLDIPDAPAEVRREAYLSAAVLKVHKDRTYPGSIVASLSVPWGNSSDSSGGYHLVWTRDCVETGLALLAAGQTEDAHSMLSYLIATQKADGTWSQNQFTDGRPFWTGIQLDEVAFPIILATKLREENALCEMRGVRGMVERAATYLVQNGPISPQDRWEEDPGISPFTLGTQIVALICAATWLDQDEAAFMLSLADCWNERIEDWTYIAGGPLAEKVHARGYYVRIGPSAAAGGLRGRLNIANSAGQSVAAVAMVGMEFLHLARFGLRRPDDPRIQDTLKLVEAVLKVTTPFGIAYHRYNDDRYGEHADGSPYDGSGIGRAWPLLTGERGHFELQLGRDPIEYLQMMTRMTSRTGLIPEQVWDEAPLPERGLEPGKPTGGAMPLVWAHAEFLKLVYAREQKRPLEWLTCVEAHMRDKSGTRHTWHWRSDAPIDLLAPSRDLLIDMPVPFQAHVGFDGWTDVSDRNSSPLPFGRHGVRLSQAELAARRSLHFALYFIDEARWEGIDHTVTLPGTTGRATS